MLALTSCWLMLATLPRDCSIRRTDASAVIGLRERVLWPGRPDLCVLSEDSTPCAVHLAATHDESDSPIGVLSLFLPDDDGRAQFRKLAVDERWRRRGIGTALIEAAASEARQAGCATLFCHAREPQALFYEQRGFRRVGEPYFKYGDAGDEYVEMERELSDQ